MVVKEGGGLFLADGFGWTRREVVSRLEGGRDGMVCWWGCATYTWFSPLGANIQAATHMATMTARPMKMLHLFGENVSVGCKWG